MRRTAALLLAALAVAAPARAQDPLPARPGAAPLPAAVAKRVTDFVNAPGTIHLGGGARIPAERTVGGDVAVLEGALEVAGRVEGDVVVVNGDLTLSPGAAVTGSVTVVGGSVRGEQAARVGGEIVAYAGRVDYRREGGRIAGLEPRAGGRAAEDDGWRVVEEDPDERPVAREDDWDDPDGQELSLRRRDGRAEFIVATGQSYNRVEGLPITFGPVFETSGSNPFRLRVMGTYRTEESTTLDPDRWGFEARAEQFVGGHRALRVGGSVYRRVDPIEDWHLTKLENGLSTFFLHRDYRDHFEREGGSVYAMLTPPESPLSATLEVRSESHSARPAGSPWTLFDNDDPWRPQPLAATGSLTSVVLSGRMDTRNEREDPSSGWLVRAEAERAVRSTLRQQATYWVNSPMDVFPGPELVGQEYGTFTHGFVDARRYNRIGPASRLNLRLLAGGALTGEALPPQRQHALGGEGSLPGYALFSLDCGARERRVIRRTPEPSADDPEFFGAYGCDRFVLGQVEFRGDLSFRVDLGRRDRDDAQAGEDEWGEGDLDEHDLRADFGWVLFADVGRGWTRSAALDAFFRDEETAVDVGGGILLGPLGLYLAVPVTDVDRSGGVNFFIRLNPRF